jgi:hypothetical protein
VFQLEISIGIKQLPDDIGLSQLVLHRCGIHYLPELALCSAVVPHRAVTDEWVTKNGHFTLVNVIVQLPTALFILGFEFF